MKSANLNNLELNAIVSQDRITLFAEVILPVPLPRLFTYRIPNELNEIVKTGARVVVQFGPRKVYTGLIARLHSQAPDKYQAKYILELLDDSPQVNNCQLELFEWMAEYYMCNIGEVMNAALPSGFKLSSKSRIQLNPDFNLEHSGELSAKEEELLQLLAKYDSLPYDEAGKLLNVKNIYNILKTLIARKAVILIEELKEKYKPKTAKKVRLNPRHIPAEQMEQLFARLEKTPKQLNILLKFLQHVPVHTDASRNHEGIEKKLLAQEEISISSLNTLIKNSVLLEFEQVVSRFDHVAPTQLIDATLTPAQTKAHDQIFSCFQETDTVLLHGITGSGKTEVYIELIKKVLESGSQVLFMLPEIALTTQIVARLKKVFGSTMGVYHSKFSDNERVEVWKGILSGEFSFIVGVRSSIFLPFDNLGLIIVDEEHEMSYKQQDPAPRYHGRDVAMMLGHKHKAKVLLGSATPSVETYFHTKSGRYGLVELMERYGDAQLPEMTLIDTRKERQMKTMKNEFSSALLNGLGKTLQAKQQAILFQNRRGYAPYISCQDCDWIPKCTQCAVSLTYHMYNNELRCHYCGHIEPVVSECPECTSTKIKTVGYGTEKLEEELKLFLPEARVQRMDLDTTRKKNSYQEIISEFEERKIDILVGTQMVSKGLDFDHVNLVGIFDADRMLHFPDFRSYERTFQLITQVSGRAGRRSSKGLVLIQTSNPQLPILKKIIEGNYMAMFFDEIEERNKYGYPPFTRIIKITVKHEDKTLSSRAASILAQVLAKHLGNKRVLGPQPPLVERIRNLYLQEIILKLERDKINIKAVKSMILNEINLLNTEKAFKDVMFVPDVDPA